jgi:hypothetical protein
MPRLAYDKPTKVCVDCKVEYPTESFEVNNKYHTKTGKTTYHRRNQCKKCRLRYRRERHAKIAHLPEVKYKKRMQGLRERYGISAEQYLEIAEKQENLCAICGNPPGSQALSVDHDHETGEIRALLCAGCNLGLGWFRDNIEVMRQAIEYLRKHGVK